jgi:metallo-beta-lactamase family protein
MKTGATAANRLKAAIDRALENGGTVVIPAFSVGRTQELLYELEGLIHNARSERWRELEIIVDSPLAARFTEVYRELKPWWDAEAHRRCAAAATRSASRTSTPWTDHEAHERTVEYLVRAAGPRW